MFNNCINHLSLIALKYMSHSLRILCFDELNIDLEDAVADKIVKNGEKYPVDTSKGSTMKRITLKEKLKNLMEL